MSKEDIYAEEVARRRKSIEDIQNGLIDINAALEQFNDLDETYKGEQAEFKERLECIYKETRHYNGKWPIVYSNSQTERHPYFNGDADDDCNPYYRISKVIAGEDDGIAPLFSETTRTGGSAINRDRNYANENTLRSTALAALNAYPDTSNEGAGASGGSCSGEDNPPQLTEAACILDNGTWTPEYGPGTTAPEILEDALTPWRAALLELKADLCTSELEDTGNAASDLIDDIVAQIDIIFTELPAPPTYPDTTPPLSNGCSDPIYLDKVTCEFNGEIWLADLKDAIEATIDHIDNDMPNDIDPRKASLNGKSNTLEQKHFGIIGLRLHQINGSYSKVQSLKDQKKTNLGLIEDNKKSIANINVLRVNDS